MHSIRDRPTEWACTYAGCSFSHRSPKRPRNATFGTLLYSGGFNPAAQAPSVQDRERYLSTPDPQLHASRTWTALYLSCPVSMELWASSRCKRAQVNGEREVYTLGDPNGRRSVFLTPKVRQV